MPTPATPDGSFRDVLGAVDRERTGLAGAIVVLLVCGALSSLAWWPLGAPARWVAGWFGTVPNCDGYTPGTSPMYVCSLKIALLTIAPPFAVLAVLWLLRSAVRRGLRRLAQALPAEARFLVPPCAATVAFALFWAPVHDMSQQPAPPMPELHLLPQRMFPAVAGLLLFSAGRHGPAVQRWLRGFFDRRDRVPRWLRVPIAVAFPLAFSYLATRDESTVQHSVLKEQLTVIAALIFGYLALARRVPAAGARR